MELNRREVLGAAGVAAAAGLAPAAAEAAAPQAPASAHATQVNTLALSQIDPQVVRDAGTVTKATPQNFPVVAGNSGTVFWLVLKPGGIREPHWHPNAWEFDIPVSGRGTLGVVNPDDTWSQHDLGPGDIGFVPKGFAHYIANRTNKTLRWAVVFNDSKPTDIGLSTMFGGMPTNTIAATLGLPAAALAHADKSAETAFIVHR